MIRLWYYDAHLGVQAGTYLMLMILAISSTGVEMITFTRLLDDSPAQNELSRAKDQIHGWRKNSASWRAHHLRRSRGSARDPSNDRRNDGRANSKGHHL